MKADAIREVAAMLGTSEEPSDNLAREAVSEVVTIALDFFENMGRIANAVVAVEKLYRDALNGH